MRNSIVTNNGGIFINNAMVNARNKLNLAQMQLSSGLKAANPSVDPAGNSVATQLQSNVELAQSIQNSVTQGSSIMSLGVGILQSITNVISRMSNLAIQATSANIDDSSRAQLDAEFQELLAQIDINASTSWANHSLFTFSGQTDSSIQVGISPDAEKMNFSFGDMTVNGLELTEQTINTIEDAQSAYSLLGEALTSVLNQLANVAAYKARLDIVDETMTTLIQDLQTAKSAYADADIPGALIDAQRAQALFDAGSAALQQNLLIFTRLAHLIEGALR